MAEDGVAPEPRRRSVQCSSRTGLHRIAYLEWGDPRNRDVLVCVHGLTRSSRDFDALAAALCAQFRVVCPDLAGRGDSERLADPALYVLPQYVSDMVTLVARLDAAAAGFDAYRPVLGDRAGVDVAGLSEPVEVRVRSANVAGVRVPVLEDVRFGATSYSLFGTPPWVDRAIADLRVLARLRAEAEVLEERQAVLARELVRVIQRVNLFEKVKIPESRRAIQRIRIHLGDEMAATVGRSKMAKAGLSAGSVRSGGAP